ncbi:hypothetical protein F5884DRAFT_806331 [Xylogone sp. PMI_703]|nr:hypothetical protein F5884DRAFT_806331 [Xylogone sp. PMI_703]
MASSSTVTETACFPTTGCDVEASTTTTTISTDAPACTIPDIPDLDAITDQLPFTIPSGGDGTTITIGPGNIPVSTTTRATTTTTTTTSASAPSLTSLFFIGLATHGFGADQDFFGIAWPENLNCQDIVSSSTNFTTTLIDTNGNTIEPVNFNTYIVGASGFTLRGACGFNEDIVFTGSVPAFVADVGSAHIVCERENFASTGCSDNWATEPFFDCFVKGSNDFCFRQQG